ncbi:hypothetical protein [Streptomyces sp. ODS28]|uniref:hypothetical protein n=1 Tax=Streptomyces sp. ODS28 TaxID=3136688 RepID=UPI0031EEF6A1
MTDPRAACGTRAPDRRHPEPPPRSDEPLPAPEELFPDGTVRHALLATLLPGIAERLRHPETVVAYYEDSPKDGN